MKTKICNGPGHDVPTALPATEKYFYAHKSGKKIGKLSARCRLCVNWERLKSPGLSGLVPAYLVRPFFEEMVYRLGIHEASRRSNINTTTIRGIISDIGTGRKVQKRTVRKLMLELISARRKNEVRHRASIHHGSALRGRKERAVVSKEDLYQPIGDEERERDRLRKRRDRA